MRQLLILLVLFMPFVAFSQTSLYESPRMICQEISDDFADTMETKSYYRLFLGQEDYALEYNSTFKWSSKPNLNNTTSLCLSYGSYRKDDNQLSFVDSVCGFVMHASIDELGNVHFSQAISSMKNQSLSFKKSFSSSDTLTSIPSIKYAKDAHLREVNQSCMEYKSQDIHRILEMGYYASMFNRLLLKSDSTFVYYYGNNEFVYSIGKWSRIGNLLLLQDDNLKQPFFALIEKDHVLKSAFLPNAVFDGTFFYFGFNPDGPSTEELNYPLIGDDFLNASFKMKINDRSSLKVSFFNHEYAIEQTVWKDMAFRYTISFGSYRKSGNDLFLKDSINGYSIYFLLSHDTASIVMKKGFVFCQDKPFSLIGKTWHSPFVSSNITEIDFDSIAEIYRHQDQIIPVPDGLYQLTKKGNFSYKLLLKNSTFLFMIDDIVYFHGSFKRECNVLIMNDMNINKPIITLIEADGVVPFLPGLFGNEKLKLCP